MNDRNGCTCATRDPMATEHRELCPLRHRDLADAVVADLDEAAIRADERATVEAEMVAWLRGEAAYLSSSAAESKPLQMGGYYSLTAMAKDVTAYADAIVRGDYRKGGA